MISFISSRGWNPESTMVLESGIHHFGMESGIQKVGIQNPDAGIRNLEAGIRNPGPSWILLHGATPGSYIDQERPGNYTPEERWEDNSANSK